MSGSAALAPTNDRNDTDRLHPLRRTVSYRGLAYSIRTLLRFSAQRERGLSSPTSSAAASREKAGSAQSAPTVRLLVNRCGSRRSSGDTHGVAIEELVSGARSACDDWTGAAPRHGRERRLSMGQVSTTSAGCLMSRGLWSGDIRLLSQLPTLEACQPRGRKGDEQLAAMVPLLRARWGRQCRRVEDTNVRRLAF
jgi:hypothetical protein